MLFNSIEFLIFFPVVACAYFLIPHRFRWALLLVASYLFYASWRAEYLVLILASTVVDFLAGLMMAKYPTREGRGKFLAASLVCNLGLLFTFKYFNFFSGNANVAMESLGLSYALPAVDLVLPVGISFYTFQTLSYTIEVYWGTQEPERRPGIFALYVAFFPQLVAGPIERSKRLLPQFLERHNFDARRATQGLRLILFGMFKKVVVADRLAPFVDEIYGSPTEHTGPVLLLATVFFTFQIYCDFSGYSDIAIGTARIMGFDLMLNFKRPYAARSISDFWKRWHISLSTWFRDYVYLPLGGNRVALLRWTLNILAVFIISGLWHGANTTFLVWGALHGTYYLVSRATARLRKATVRLSGLHHTPRIHAVLQVLFIFTIVSVGWVFFRAHTLSDAAFILWSLPSGWDGLITGETWEQLTASAGMPFTEWWLAFACIGALIIVEKLHGDEGLSAMLDRWPTWLRWLAYLGTTMAIFNLGAIQDVPFIYFQF